MKRFVVNFTLVLGFMSSSFFTTNVPAQADIVFRNPTVENLYPKHVIFRVEACGVPSTSPVIFNYMVSQSGTWEKGVRTFDDGQTSDGCYKQKYFLETQNLYIPPFSEIEYFWSVTEEADGIRQSSRNIYTYKNETYTWKSLENESLIVWWHDRPDSFGQEVISVATVAYQDQAEFYSFSLEAPITIVITNTAEEFFAWQPRKNDMSGIAFSEFSLTIQLVEENAYYYGWLNEVIPHEISHIYFGRLLKKESKAPRWFNEGLAVYHEHSSHWSRWSALQAAQARGEILALNDLDHNFDKDLEKIELAYAESYYAVLFMDEVYGKDAIATLLQEYRKGTGTTMAFENSFGKDPESFERDFIVWLEKRLKTPPPDTDLPQPIFKGIVYFWAGMFCLGGFFVMTAGTIFVVILVILGRRIKV